MKISDIISDFSLFFKPQKMCYGDIKRPPNSKQGKDKTYGKEFGKQKSL